MLVQMNVREKEIIVVRRQHEASIVVFRHPSHRWQRWFDYVQPYGYRAESKQPAWSMLFDLLEHAISRCFDLSNQLRLTDWLTRRRK